MNNRVAQLLCTNKRNEVLLFDNDQLIHSVIFEDKKKADEYMKEYIEGKITPTIISETEV